MIIVIGDGFFILVWGMCDLVILMVLSWVGVVFWVVVVSGVSLSRGNNDRVRGCGCNEWWSRDM